MGAKAKDFNLKMCVSGSCMKFHGYVIPLQHACTNPTLFFSADNSKAVLCCNASFPVSILYKSITCCVWVVDGPIMARFRFIKNAAGFVRQRFRTWRLFCHSVPHLSFLKDFNILSRQNLLFPVDPRIEVFSN